MENLQTVWVLQLRSSGEEDYVTLYRTEQGAIESAIFYLRDILQWHDHDLSDNATLDEIGDYCSDNDIAYFEIYEQNIN